MEPFVRLFIRSSLVWLGVGVSIGLWMALDPGAVIYRPAHMHANLLGFVSMMIFGVAYHVLPRFSGAPLRSRAAAHAHVVLANTGLAALVSGWIVRVSMPYGQWILAAGGLFSALGAFLFIGNIWLTINAGTRPVRLGSVPAPARS
jgi:cbb3-type cytochrome oxidase subunit 1